MSLDSNKPKVLVVDDMEENLLVMESILETIEVDVVTARSGRAAVNATLEDEFALVLLDVQMPEMDGFETASLMRGNESTKSVPIIFVTAFGDEEQFVSRGYEVGAVDYLTKPVRPKILRSKVQAFLNLYRARRMAEESAETMKAQLARTPEAPTTLLPKDAIPPSGVTDFKSHLRWALRHRYMVQHEIGSGGMAVVFLATELKNPREVALKVLRGVGGPQGWQANVSEGGTRAARFVREVRVCATLNHPHILPLFHTGEAGGFPFFTMPYVAGGSARDLMDEKGRLPVAEAVTIAREVADALHYAHGRRIVHRDIKPENIMLSDGHAVVVDFGIARALGDTSPRLTNTGFIAGTPSYMSPELVRGQEVDGRSDVYSVAVVLYEMLTGAPPFSGPTPQAVVAASLTDEPRHLSDVRRDLPDGLVAAVMTALAKRPRDRQADAAAFRKELEDL